jgi:hypothetical protein
MNEPTIILTHCGKLGDLLYCLPIASWMHKTRGVKIHWVLPECFPPFRYVRNLLMRQAATADVTLVGHQCGWSGHGGEPYKFDPADFGTPENPLTGEYYNLGFRSYPQGFVTEFYAQEHGFGWDRDFTIEFDRLPPAPDLVLRSEQPQVKFMAPAHAIQYPMPIDWLLALQLLAMAGERHLWYSGPASLCYLARLPFHLHYMDGHPSRTTYHPEEFFGGKLITMVYNPTGRRGPDLAADLEGLETAKTATGRTVRTGDTVFMPAGSSDAAPARVRGILANRRVGGPCPLLLLEFNHPAHPDLETVLAAACE